MKIPTKIFVSFGYTYLKYDKWQIQLVHRMNNQNPVNITSSWLHVACLQSQEGPLSVPSSNKGFCYSIEKKREKGRDLTLSYDKSPTLSYDKSPYTDRNVI